MSPTPDASAVEVLISYSHKDERFRRVLETHLSPLKRQGHISVWHDRQIGAGTDWEGQLHARLESAGVILLLVSPDFIASDYCYDVELKRAVERHEAGTARVIPIILRPVDWQDTPFRKLQALPTDGKPISKWPNRDEAYRTVVEGIRRAIRELASRHTPAGRAEGIRDQLDQLVTEVGRTDNWTVREISEFIRSPLFLELRKAPLAQQTPTRLRIVMGAFRQLRESSTKARPASSPGTPATELPQTGGAEKQHGRESRDKQITNLQTKILDRSSVAVTWHTSAAMAVHLSLYSTQEGNPVRIAGPVTVQAPGLSGLFVNRHVFHLFTSPGETYYVVAESDSDRRTAAFTVFEDG